MIEDQSDSKSNGKVKKERKYLDEVALSNLMDEYRQLDTVEQYSFVSQGIDDVIQSEFELRSPFKNMKVRLMTTSPQHLEVTDNRYLIVSE